MPLSHLAIFAALYGLTEALPVSASGHTAVADTPAGDEVTVTVVLEYTGFPAPSCTCTTTAGIGLLVDPFA